MVLSRIGCMSSTESRSSLSLERSSLDRETLDALCDDSGVCGDHETLRRWQCPPVGAKLDAVLVAMAVSATRCVNVSCCGARPSRCNTVVCLECLFLSVPMQDLPQCRHRHFTCAVDSLPLPFSRFISSVVPPPLDEVYVHWV